MNARANKPQENKSKAIANNLAKGPSVSVDMPAQFIDNRPETIAQKKLQTMANAGKMEVAQKSKNETGLPDQLKSGIENLSGISMDQVKVHYNSERPKQVNALAYAKGSDIHVGPGQEKHLAHEAWHVVQQAQGRVKPTAQFKNSFAINNNPELEKEADVMGSMALRSSHISPGNETDHQLAISVKSDTAQLQCAPQGIAWGANYQNSGLDINALFTDDHLTNRDTQNTDNRGTFAHEYIQGRYGAWTPEYGIPPALPDYPGWGYADMVNAKRIYEIKPNGGMEDAVAQATGYVAKANVNNAGHVLAGDAINGRDLMRERVLPILSHRTGQIENDTVKLYLSYRNSRAGEVLYEWEIINESAVAREKAREKVKRDQKNKEEKEKKQAKVVKGMPTLGSMFAASASKAMPLAAPMDLGMQVEVGGGGGMMGGEVMGGGMGMGGGQMPQAPSHFDWGNVEVPQPVNSAALDRPQLIMAVAMDFAGLDEVIIWLQANGCPEDEIEWEAADILRAAGRIR